MPQLERSSETETPSSTPEKKPTGCGLRLVAPLLIAAASFLLPSVGRAQTGVESASVTGKGIAGGALLGAEAVVLAEAALRVKPRWAYLVGAGIGAAGGGVGGYFLERSLSPKAGMFMLAGGMVLAIPATIAALSASSYSVQDYIELNNPPRDQASTREARTADAETLSLLARPPALVGLDEGSWSVGVPAIELLEVYPMEMRQAFHLDRETELRVPMFAMRF